MVRRKSSNPARVSKVIPSRMGSVDKWGRKVHTLAGTQGKQEQKRIRQHFARKQAEEWAAKSGPVTVRRVSE